jgi:quercetin dioxygenase-like cupin family protein
MEVKYNEATRNRPWGERPIDAPVVPIDLHAYTQELMQEEAWQKYDRNAITVFKTDKLTVTLIALHKDTEMKPATVDGTGVMTLQVLDGVIKFHSEKERLELNRGQMIVLHEHIPYTAVAQEESVCLLTMAR